MPDQIDALDLRILVLAVREPRAGVREFARRLGVARGTVQARLDKLEKQGVLTGWGPVVDPGGLGYASKAYIRLSVAQGVLDAVTEGLSRIPEVIELDSVAGDSDLLCLVVARGPENLEEVIQRILGVPGVTRSRTEPVLRQRIPRRILPLIEALRRDR
ncbi:Lrp/AsnC family transcriptional regulator [Actinoplanes sp. HUAS TT8]|uniref:Lrp/AsnC family transcriptional regulator n=1 Tax=Actinoplanes sp. HUAS TT8 TaxID=3447453 RepID=UPI003F5255CE